MGPAVALAALAVYVLSLAPGLTFQHNGADGGDLIAAAVNLGVPHPPGYPTYTLLAWAISLLPIGGSLAYRVNLLSAVCASCAVGLAYGCARRLLPPQPHNRTVSVATALTLAFSSLFWSQAIIAEVYSLLALFACLLLYLLLRWRREQRDPLLWWAALTMGLGMGNHPTLALAMPAAVLWLWPERRRWLRARTLLPAALLFLAGLSVYVYLPLAASRYPAVNWGNPQTWQQFRWLVTARLYQGNLFGLDAAAAPSRLVRWAALIGDQVGWSGLAIAISGVCIAWKRSRLATLAALLWTACTALFAFSYDSADSFVYLAPLMPLLALFWGQAAGCALGLLRARSTRWTRPALILLLLLPCLSLALHWRGVSLAGERAAQQGTKQTLAGIPPGALVLVREDRPTFALWYAVHAERQRSDLAVVSSSLLDYSWYREVLRHTYPDLVVPEPAIPGPDIDVLARELITANYPVRPVYATDPSDAWLQWFDLSSSGNGAPYRAQLKTRWESVQ